MKFPLGAVIKTCDHPALDSVRSDRINNWWNMIAVEQLEANKGIVERMAQEVWYEGGVDVIDELVAEEYVLHEPTLPEPVRGRDGLKQFNRMFRAAFPVLNAEEDIIIAEDDLVAHRWTLTGTHEGALHGIEPTGVEVTVSGIEFDRIVDGQIAEAWVVYDALGMMRQLGVVPEEPDSSH